MHFALTWQEGYPVSGVDTDLSAMMYTEKGEFVDVCYFNKLAVDGGAIALSGDARSGNPGAPPSDLEALTMHLQGVAPQVRSLHHGDLLRDLLRPSTSSCAFQSGLGLSACKARHYECQTVVLQGEDS